MASIVKKEIKKGIQFQVRYRIDGRQKTKTFTSNGKTVTAIKEAERKANRFAKEIEAEIALGLATDESDMLFYDCIWHVYNIKFETLEETTVANYKIYINQVCDYFGKMKLKDITPMTIERFFIKQAKIKSRRILKFYWSLLENTLDYAFKKDLIGENPMLKVEFIEPNESPKKNKIMPINENDIKVLLANITMKKYEFLVKFMIYTGMRVGEAQAVTWDDVDYKKRVIKINKSYKRTNKVGTTKTKRHRTTILHDALIELLNEIKFYQKENKNKFGDAYEENNLIICNEDGSYIKYAAIKSYFERLDKRLDKKVRTHRFRHTFASRLILKQQLNPKVVQKLLGHQKISTTLDIYTDLFDNEYDKETHESLNEAFAENTTKIQHQNGKNII